VWCDPYWSHICHYRGSRCPLARRKPCEPPPLTHCVS
jgi:hypothetical protein